MSHSKLLPGDRVYFVQNGRKLRAVVGDSLPLKVRREELKVPVTRPRRVNRCHADLGPKRLRVRWIERSKLRKLP